MCAFVLPPPHAGISQNAASFEARAGTVLADCIRIGLEAQPPPDSGAAPSKFPAPVVLVACAASAADVPAPLRRCFTHEIEVQPPDVAQRRSMLRRWLAPPPPPPASSTNLDALAAAAAAEADMEGGRSSCSSISESCSPSESPTPPSPALSATGAATGEATAAAGSVPAAAAAAAAAGTVRSGQEGGSSEEGGLSEEAFDELARHTAGLLPRELRALSADACALAVMQSVAPMLRVLGSGDENAGLGRRPPTHNRPAANALKLAVPAPSKHLTGALGDWPPLVGRQHVSEALEGVRARTATDIGAPKIPNVRWEDVGGLEDVKRAILDTGEWVWKGGWRKVSV
jgi:hypothetical protein